MGKTMAGLLCTPHPRSGPIDKRMDMYRELLKPPFVRAGGGFYPYIASTLQEPGEVALIHEELYEADWSWANHYKI